jgi:hypothetical protein
MFLLLIYFFILFAYFYYLAPTKSSLTITSKSKPTSQPVTTEQFEEPLPELHYIKGFDITIPQPAYKANTNIEDRMINDIPSQIKKSKGKNISKIFEELANDNFNLFVQSKHVVMPSSYTNNYVNVPKISNNFATSTYTMDKNDPGIDTYSLAPIFATGLPKIN